MIEKVDPSETIVKMTPDEFAEMIRHNKPYLLDIEEMIAKTEYGEVDVKLTVRAGVVEKVSTFSVKTKLYQKKSTPA